MRALALLCVALVAICVPAAAKKASPASAKDEDKDKKEEKKDVLSAGTFSGLELREIGPALTSGRVIDIAIDPHDHAVRYVAAASSGVWKTTNSGTTWKAVFASQPSYSIGCVVIDPKDPLVVWVGTGENNSQRSVAYGDGVYKSLDGGATWSRVGLEKSEHIGKILIDPTNSQRVFVAAQGPLWADGGDRGLYRTTDGGKTWKRVLDVSTHTGVTDVVMDPRDPNTLWAASYQRRRHMWTLIDGGPESTIYKSTDGGESWRKVEKGLPEGDKGRIGLAVSPVDPDVVYAWVEAQRGDSGFFRSSNRGESWEKRGGYISTSPQYYQEIVADPHVLDRVYAMDTFMKVTNDGGKTWSNAGEHSKHVDNHALWIDPDDSDHLVNGNDGGVYESWDRAKTWTFTTNLPLTQFYRVSLDNDKPFYNVYGGTQDNESLGGPSRTIDVSGIVSADWWVTLGGDGFESAIDPEDPNVVYSQFQYGSLFRYDKKSGEIVDIQPQPGPGEPANRWNWDSALMISPHSHTRLYFASQRLWKSDDRGNTWTAISPDLTRQIDRNKLKVMGRVWGVDTVAKNASTSFYGNIVALSESPLVEGMLYVGTDDGLIQVSEDGGAHWRQQVKFPGVPDMAYVSDLEASRFDKDTVYASFENHTQGDFKPYVLRSSDRGRSWTAIAGDLPKNGMVWTLAQDHVRAPLLFAGTEFGLYFSPDEGKKWIELEGGLPTIAVRDLDVQRRENDLALATFGRGFWILDDYTPLRQASRETLEKPATLFPVKDALAYMERYRVGGKGKAFMGETWFTADNPPFGAVFTYYLKEGLKSLKEQRQEREGKADKKGEDVFYPTWEELRAEDRAEDPAIVLTVSDPQGNVLRRLTGPVSKGFHRVAWDLRFPSSEPVRLERHNEEEGDDFEAPTGPMAAPGSYRVQLAQRIDGVVTNLGEPQSFTVKPLENAALPVKDRAALLAFQRQTADLQRAALGAVRAVAEATSRLDALMQAIVDTPRADVALRQQALELKRRFTDLDVELEGDPTVARRNEPVPPAIVDRVQQVVLGSWASTSETTATHVRNYKIASQQLAQFLPKLKQAAADLEALEKKAEELGAPWTPGRIPNWPHQ
ncbi:MAG TPA: glycosyl hydrolase, partial [Thermoanaerobaculia bacterium]|nr:glycosyl hydrolase [Thermoanaerobaculia bacterium]